MPANPAAPVTMTQLDARLVRALELCDAATLFTAGAQAAGSAPPRPLRHRGRRAPARPAHEPSRRPGRARAPAQRPGQRAPRPPTRSRRSSASASWEHGLRRGPRRRFVLPQLDCLAEARARRPPSASSATRTSGAARARRRSRRSARRPRAASTAPASSGASTSCRRTQAARRSPTTLQGRTTYQMSGEVPRASGSRSRSSQPADVALLRRERAALEAGAGRPHGHLPRQRLVHPLLRATASPLARSTGWYGQRSPGAAGRSPRRASFLRLP